MNTSSVHTQDGVFKRVLLLYGLVMLLTNAAFLLGYYLLPEGLLRGSPTQAGAAAIAATPTFWSQVGSTFLFNLGALIVGCVWLNLFQFKGLPLGYLGLIIGAISSGVVAGTNSFFMSDMTRVNVRDGMAANLSIGGLEFFADMLTVASTVAIVVYEFNSWKQLLPTKIRSFRDIRLSKAEVLCLIGGIVLLFVAAYVETALAPQL